MAQTYNVQIEDSAGNKYYPKPDLLTTQEQLAANNAAGKSVDALVIKAINNDLKSHPQFIYDEYGKITGYKTSGGADTVFPFRSQLSTARKKTGSKSISSGGTATITLENKPLLIYVGFDSQKNHIWIYNDDNPIEIKGGTTGYTSPTLITNVDVDNKKFTIKNIYDSTRTMNYSVFY